MAVGEGDGGIPHGDLLAGFAEAVVMGGDSLEQRRGELHERLGNEAFVEACATVGVFNGLVRTADSIGIPLDQRTLEASARDRESLGLNRFAGSRNSDRV